jgi:hypothetical protein
VVDAAPAREAEILRTLDRAVFSSTSAEALEAIAGRVRGILARGPSEIEAWEAIPLELYASGLPEDVRSSWMFGLRRGVVTGAERHPNSRQRMASWAGGGDFQVHDGPGWRSHRLVSDRHAPFERRWLSIPPETWHQGVVGPEDWLVVSFHTVPAADLVEERPDPADPDPFRPRQTRRRRYLEVSQP